MLKATKTGRRGFCKAGLILILLIVFVLASQGTSFCEEKSHHATIFFRNSKTIVFDDIDIRFLRLSSRSTWSIYT